MITVYGYSDDLIELEGDIEDELDSYDLPMGSLLLFSDGTLLKVTYSDVWTIDVVEKGPNSNVSKIAAVSPEDQEYSDRVTIDPLDDTIITWVKRIKLSEYQEPDFNSPDDTLTN